MKTVGEILKKARLEKKLTLEEVEIATKIRKKFLQALEENDFSKLPSYSFGRGFLKNYAEFLGLSSRPILAIFKRDFGRPEITQKLPKNLGKEIKWSPKLTVIVVGIVFFLGLSFWLGYQYLSLKRAPFLQVIFPPEGKQVSEEKIEIVGKTQPDALVTINDVPVVLSWGGEFHYQQDLFPGENKIVIVAKNRLGKETKVQRTIFRLDK